MKHSLFLLFITLSMVSYGQGFKFKKVYVEQAIQQDMVDDLSYQYFANRLPEGSRNSLRYADMDAGHYYGGVCENPATNFGFTLTHDQFENFEWRNGFSYMPDRVDGVTYHDYNDYYGGDYVNVNARHDEIALESSLHYKYSPVHFLHFYGGLGANVGYTYNNEMCYYTTVQPSTDELSFRNAGAVNRDVSDPSYSYYSDSQCFSGGNDFTQRLFASIGIGLELFGRAEFGLNIKRGVGNRLNSESSSIQTNFYSTSIRAAYIIQ